MIKLKNVLKAAAGAFLIASGVGALAGAGLLGAGAAATVAAAGGALSFGITAAALTGASALVSSVLGPKPPSIDLSQSIRGQLITGRSPSEPARIVYGETRLGGNIVFIQTQGATNETLYQVITIASGETQSLEAVYANDDNLNIAQSGNVYTTTYQGSTTAIELAWFPGTDTQSATSLLSGTDASSYQFKGIAALVCKLTYNQDLFPYGVPNFTVKVRGRKVYDPRTETTAYSTNAALCILDYLTNTDFGLGARPGEIDLASFITAANICDQDVDLDAGGSEKRYTINGAFSTSETPQDVIQKMLTACGGKLSYVGGKWILKVAAWSEPTVYLSEGDIISDITVQASQSRRDIFNAVKGVYSEPSEFYQPVSFPPVTNATYELEDGERIWQDVQYAFTTSSPTCQRLSKIELERARQQIAVNIECNLKAFNLQPGDTVYLSLDKYGWEYKVFEVLNWSFTFLDGDAGARPSINLLLRETAEEIYDWDAEETEIDLAPNTTLPNAFVVNPVQNLQVTKTQSVLVDGSTSTGLLVEWNAPNSAFTFQYEVQWKRAQDLFDYGLVTNSATETENYGLITSSADNAFDWGSISVDITSGDPNFNSVIVSGTQFTIPSVIPNAKYLIRVRAINTLGVRSIFSTLNTTPTEDTTPPANIGSLTAVGAFRQIRLTWSNPVDPDLDIVEVFRNSTNNVNTATKIAVLRGSTYNDTGLNVNQLLYYWVRPVDRSGNAGNFAGSASATTSFVDVPDFSQSVLNLFSEAGAYGIEPFASNPTSGGFDGQIIFNTTERKLYQWDTTLSPPAWSDDLFSIQAGTVDLASFDPNFQPIGIVNTLPNPVGYTGAKIVFLTTDNKLYRYDDSSSPAVFTTQILAADVQGAFSSDNFPNNLRPIEVVANLPTTGNFAGRTVFLTADNKIYRHNGSIFTASVPTSDLSGSITNAQVESLAAAKLTGQITNTQITDNAITTPKIQAGAVITSKIATNAITSDLITSGAIIADKLGVGSVQAGAIAADAVTAEKIAAGSITTGKIAAGAITATQIAAETITSDKISAGSIQGDRIAANSITAGLLAASGVITDTAQINNGVITNANIANGAIDSAKISNVIQSSNFVSGVDGWQINKNGDAEFNGIVISRQLQVDSGDFSIGTVNDDGNNSTFRELTSFIIETNTDSGSWAGPKFTYLAVVGRKAGAGFGTIVAQTSVVTTLPSVIWWGYKIDLIPFTRWSGPARIAIRVGLWSRYVVQWQGFTLTWRIYKVT